MLLRTTCLISFTSLIALPALAEESFPAKLAGHAALPALTLIPAPEDAPQDLQISGKFTGKTPNHAPETVMGDVGKAYGNHPTGIKLPFKGQPVQGMSGYAMTRASDGSFYTLTDNGFGSKLNSPDAMLMFHKMAPDFATGEVTRQDTIFLRDPDFKVPFRIANEASPSRYLTGADFDPESIQVIGDQIWIGDEFGPYLLQIGADGVVLNVYAAQLDGQTLSGPDTPGLTHPATPGKDFRVQRSGGYEGMGLQPGTGLLWPLLEKPLLAENGEAEGNFLRMLPFDPAKAAFTGESYKFQLAEGATAIGDFNFIDESRALIIERDNGEGDQALACAAGASDTAACYPQPAKVKNVVLVDTAQIDADGFVKRIGHINLLAIEDPDQLAREGMKPAEGPFSFPFFTIENVVKVDESHIMVGNDNNLPYSGGREIGKAANNEFILLSVPELLSAK